MIKKLLLIKILFSLSLGAVPPNFIKLLDSPDENIVVPAKFGVIQNDTLWLNPEAECSIWLESFENLIKEQHARKAPFLLAVTQSDDKSGKYILEMYEAHALNKQFFGDDYLWNQCINREVELEDDKDIFTRKACHQVNYYMLSPEEKLFKYVGNFKEFNQLKELFWKSFPSYIEDDPILLNFMGISCLYGKDVGQNYYRAQELFERAAEIGNANAMNYLGNMHVQGIGIDQNYMKAYEFFKNAARLGHQAAQFNLAVLYLTDD